MSVTSQRSKSEDEPQTHAEEARRVWVVIKLGILGLYRSNIPRMAAALAYRTLFSIIPVMVIGLLIFQSFVSDDQIDSGVRRVLDFAGITQISVVDESVVESVPDGASGEIEGAEIAEDPFAISNGSGELEAVITDLIQRVNHSIEHVPAGWIAVMSAIVLIYAALSMLIEMERSFNQVCGAPHGRPWLKRLILYWTILTLGTLMLAATFFVGDSFAKWIIGRAGEDSWFGAVLAGYGVSVLISTALLVVAFMTIPNVRVRFRPALTGAFLAAVLWELGKWGFTGYVRSSTGYTKFYGSLALLPLFLLWVYLTWVIVLLGMQAAHAMQHFSKLVEAGIRGMRGEQTQVALIDPLIGLAAARVLCERFDNGKKTTPSSLSEALGVDAAVARNLLGALEDAGVAQEVTKGEDTVGWAPVMPAEKMPMRAVLEAVYRLDGFRAGEGAERVPEGLRCAAMQAVDSQCVSDMAGALGKAES